MPAVPVFGVFAGQRLCGGFTGPAGRSGRLISRVGRRIAVVAQSNHDERAPRMGAPPIRLNASAHSSGGSATGIASATITMRAARWRSPRASAGMWRTPARALAAFMKSETNAHGSTVFGMASPSVDQVEIGATGQVRRLLLLVKPF